MRYVSYDVLLDSGMEASVKLAREEKAQQKILFTRWIPAFNDHRDSSASSSSYYSPTSASSEDFSSSDSSSSDSDIYSSDESEL